MDPNNSLSKNKNKSFLLALGGGKRHDGLGGGGHGRFGPLLDPPVLIRDRVSTNRVFSEVIKCENSSISIFSLSFYFTAEPLGIQ